MSHKQKLNIIDVKDLDKLILIPFGDMHWGSKDTDEDRIKRDLEWCIRTPNVRVIFGGDNIDAGIVGSVGSRLFDQKNNAQEQIEEWCELVKPLVDTGKVIGTHTGNHEEGIKRVTGLDVTKMMARMVGIKYFDYTVMHYVLVGNQNYTIYSTHGNSGSRLPHTKIKAVIDRANVAGADIYLMWHLHALDHHVREYYSIDKRSRTVKEEEKHFVLCGAYLNHWGSYGDRAGYELLKKGSPKVKLSGLEKRIRISL